MLFTQIRWRTITTVGTTLALVAAAGSATARSPKHPATASYDIFLSLRQAHYDSTSTTPGDCGGTETETDSFGSYAYYRITLPLHGAAPRALSLKSYYSGLAVPSFVDEGQTNQCPPLGPVSYRCESTTLSPGDGGPPRLLGSPSGARRETLKLYIEAVPHLYVHDTQGNFAPGRSCAEQFDGHEAFSPANSTLMPDMFAARVSWSLGQLRRMRKGTKVKLKLAGPSPEDAPRFDCSIGPVTCSQHLRWHGVIHVTRVS